MAWLAWRLSSVRIRLGLDKPHLLVVSCFMSVSTGGHQLNALGQMLMEASNRVAPAVLEVDGTLDDRIDRYRMRNASDPHYGQVEVLAAVMRGMRGEGPRHIIVHSGKRSGKTTIATDLVMDVVETNPESMIWIGGPTYDIANKIFDATVDDWPAEQVRLSPTHHAYFGNSGELKTKSWENVKSIEADGVHLLILDECQNLTELAYRKFRTRTVSTGGITVMFGAPAMDSLWFLDMIEKAKQEDSGIAYIYFPTSANPLEEVQKYLEEERQNITDEEYKEYYEGLPTRTVGAMFPTYQAETHNIDFDWDPELPVHLAIDPGYNWYAVDAIQVLGGVPHVIYSIHGEGVTDLEMVRRAASQPWYLNMFKQGSSLVTDRAAKAHRNESERTTASVWEEYTGLKVITNFVNIEAGTKVLADFLRDPSTGQPNIFFHRDNTKPLAREFALYKRNVNGHPIDRDNHHIKAIIYWLVAQYGYTPTIIRRKKKPVRHHSRPIQLNRHLYN